MAKACERAWERQKWPRSRGRFSPGAWPLGKSLCSNHGFFSVVNLGLKRTRACRLLRLPLRNIKIQRSNRGAQDAAEEVLIAVLVKHQLASRTRLVGALRAHDCCDLGEVGASNLDD